MSKLKVASIVFFFLLAVMTVPASADSFTNFEGFATGTSVDGQGGWGVSGAFDEAVVDDGSGNTVWRVSNAITSGAFGNQPFAPRPAGPVIDPTTDPINSTPGAFAGESSTGAMYDRFYAEFDFRSATGAAQTGLSLTISPDSGTGGRQSYVAIKDNGSGLDVTTYDVDSSGNFVYQGAVASGLSYAAQQKLAFELLFNDGPDNDVANIYVNGTLVHTGTSWEQYYTNYQSSLHPFGVPVQTLLFRISGAAEASVNGGGYFIDNVSTTLSYQEQAAAVPEPSTLLLLGSGIVGLVFFRRSKKSLV